MALIRIIEVPESEIRLGFDPEVPEVQMLINDVLEMKWGGFDTHAPPVCAICLEDGNEVEQDGICEHGKLSYYRKVGLI